MTTVQAYASYSLLAHADLVLLVRDLFLHPAQRPADAFAADEAAIDDLLHAGGLATASALRQAVVCALAEARRLPQDQWNDEYNRLFDSAMVCPPNETAYIRRDKGAIIGDICGFYRAFGFDARADSGEKPDHLVTQLEFLSVLLAMAAAAPTDDQQQLSLDALRAFADTHLSDWLIAMAKRLESVTALPLFVAAGQALAAMYRALAGIHALALPPEHVPAPEDEPESPYECGMAPTEQLVEVGLPPHPKL